MQPRDASSLLRWAGFVEKLGFEPGVNECGTVGVTNAESVDDVKDD